MMHAGADDLAGVPDTFCIAADSWVWTVTCLICYQHGRCAFVADDAVFAMLHAGAHDLDGLPGTLCIAADSWIWAVTSLLCN